MKMSGPSRGAALATILAGVTTVAACDTGRPHALDRVDRDFALGWDTTAWIRTRGNCFNAREGARPRAGWSIPYGRYIVTLIDTTARPKLTVRGRMYLAVPSGKDTSTTTAARLSVSDTKEHPLIGATDFPFEQLGVLPDTAAPARGSFDPLRPGVLVVHLNHAAPQSDPDLAIWLNTPATIRGAAHPDSTGGIVLAVRGGFGDGFWGMWGSRGVGRVRRGFFCAGWIDA
jgi:hypothetical protein